jgi:hypothetical protein
MAAPGMTLILAQIRRWTSRRPGSAWTSTTATSGPSATNRPDQDPALPTWGTPRTYFGNESASAPADVLREADGLASWLAQQQGNIVSAKLPELIASFLASDSPDEQSSDDVDLGDADIFVEIKVSQFLRAVGLSVPRELPSA